jgi:hypothetical protein
MKCGFGVEDTQIQYSDRLAQRLLVLALALYITPPLASRTPGLIQYPPKKCEASAKKVAQLKTSFFGRGLCRIIRLILNTLPLPSIRTVEADRCYGQRYLQIGLQKPINQNEFCTLEYKLKNTLLHNYIYNTLATS